MPALDRYRGPGDAQYGVDLWDPSQATPRRVVQCKLHEWHKKLPLVEVDAEVEKAFGFPHPIDEYHFVTTAKLSADAVDRVGEINRAHRAEGRFLVVVWDWRKLSRLIDRSERAQQLVGMAPSEATLATLRREARQIHDAASSDKLASDVVEIRRRVQLGRYQEARELIQEVRERRWSGLPSDQKARVLTNLAIIEDEQGNHRRSAELLLKASEIAPEEESSWANRVVALLALEDPAAAEAAAREFAAKYPDSAGAWAALMQATPSGSAFTDVQQKLPAWARQSTAVQVALVERSARFDVPRTALETVRTVAKAHLDTPQARHRVASCWYGVCAALLSQEGVLPRSDLEELRQYLSSLIDDLEVRELHVLRADARRIRGIVHDILGNAGAASHDLSTAVEEHPCDRTRLTFAQHLLNRERHDEALSQLQRAQGDQAKSEVDFYTALARWQRNEANDRQEAVASFVRLARLCEGAQKLDALTQAVHALVVMGRVSEAADLLDEVDSQFANQVSVLRARVAWASGDREAAVAHAEYAMEALGQQPALLRRWLALLLTALGRRADALTVWLRTVPPDVLDNDTHALFQLALDLERDDVILDRGTALRAAGHFDPHLLHIEIEARERYDLDDALQVAVEAVQHLPAHRHLHVHGASVAERAGKGAEFFPLTPDLLPEPGDTRVNARVVVEMLVRRQRYVEAREYAYQVYRARPGSPEGYRCMKHAFFATRGQDVRPSPEVVDSSSAVHVRELGGKDWWFVIEPHNPDPSREEVDPSSPLGRELLGKRPGDVVKISQEPGGRSVTIEEIVSKYVHRVREVMDTFEIVVPDSPEVRVLHLGDGNGGIDFGPLIEMLKAEKESTARAVTRYTEEFRMSLHLLGHLMGRDELGALSALVKGSAPVRCATGSSEEQERVLQELQTTNEIVLDLTAALTLLCVEGGSVLAAVNRPLVTSQRTMEVLWRMLKEEPAGDGPRLWAGEDQGRLVRVEETEEGRKRLSEHISEFLREFENRVAVRPAPELVRWEPERRGVMSKVFGWHGAETLALAAQPGRMLWADDLMLGEIAMRLFGCGRAWTQLVAWHLTTASRFADESYHRLSARLLACGYEFTGINRAILEKSGELADWSISRPPLRQILAYISKPAFNAETAAELASELLRSMWYKQALPASRTNCQVAIQNALLERKDARQALLGFKNRLPAVFPLDEVSVHEARMTLVSWARSRGVLPG